MPYLGVPPTACEDSGHTGRGAGDSLSVKNDWAREGDQGREGSDGRGPRRATLTQDAQHGRAVPNVTLHW